MGGHNLEKISFKGNVIKLEGIDVTQNYEGEPIQIKWTMLVNSNKLEYLTIQPMEDKEK